MTFQKPYRSADDELSETLDRGRARLERDDSAVTSRGIGITILWVLGLAVIGFILVGTGIIDPGFCHGNMNPLSC